MFRNYAQLMAISQRIMDTKDIIHHVDCSLCKTDIKGLRFECTICTDYSICFQCFCVDTEHHTLSHRLRDAHFLSKCRLLFKKCWNVLGCGNGSSRRTQSIGMTTIKTNFDEFRNEFATITNENVSSQRSILSRRNSLQIECKCHQIWFMIEYNASNFHCNFVLTSHTGKLSSIIGLLLSENDKLSSHVSEMDDNGNIEPTKQLIRNHLEALKIIVNHLEDYSVSSLPTFLMVDI